MLSWLRRSGPEEAGDEQHLLALFTFVVLTLGVAAVGFDSYVTSKALRTNPHGYPVRLLLPIATVQPALRPPPVLMGENAALISSALAENQTAEQAGLAPLRYAPGAFDQAFGGSSTGAPLPRALPQPKLDKRGMMAVDFDLQGGAKSTKAISVRKPVAIAGADSGRLSIRIDGAAKIYANKAEVADMLEGKSDKSERVRSASGDDYVSFDQLRDMGVNIRYDPSADRIVIPPEG